MTEPTAQVCIVVHAPRPDVWNALTDPDLVRQYFMGATVSTDWHVGSPITFSGEWQGKAFEDKGEILVAEPPHRLSFSHWSPMSGTEDIDDNYHVAEIVLADENEDTKVLLTQSNLVGGVTEADRANRDEYDKNWNSVLEGLKRTVER